jgi:peptidoglycan hydrolase CwlO-like protein
MKINKQDVLLLIIILLAGYSILQMKGIKTDMDFYNTKIELIQKEIDSVQVVNEKITQQISVLDGEIDNIDGDIEKVTKNITIIKKQTNEKVDAVNEFTFSDLTKFFSDRYEGREDIGDSGHDSTSQNPNR